MKTGPVLGHPIVQSPVSSELFQLWPRLWCAGSSSFPVTGDWEDGRTAVSGWQPDYTSVILENSLGRGSGDTRHSGWWHEVSFESGKFNKFDESGQVRILQTGRDSTAPKKANPAYVSPCRVTHQCAVITSVSSEYFSL